MTVIISVAGMLVIIFFIYYYIRRHQMRERNKLPRADVNGK